MRLSQLAAAILSGALLASPVAAAPSGGQVVGGSASISTTRGTTTITEFTNQAILNWNTFSIGAGETVRFLQPSSLAVALNRVTGVDPSIILGSLQSNGRIFILNPDGILFGQGSTVNVGGLVAGTGTMSDSDFLAGRYHLTPGTSGAAVVNEGRITANRGFVVLVAPLVSNQGTIVANLGQVNLSGASEAQVNIDGHGLIDVILPVGPASSTEVLLTDQAYNQVLQQLFAGAQVVHQPGGVALVNAAGVVVNTGTIETGGGGSISLNSTHATVLDGTSSLSANGSDGGSIQVLSNGTTFVGPSTTLQATGGPSGAGGQVEVSGGQHLDFAGTVDTSAASGARGSLLIDPLTLAVVNDGTGTTAAIRNGLLTAGTVLAGTDPAGIDTVTVADIVTASKNNNVTLQASNGLVFEDTAANPTPFSLLNDHGITFQTTTAGDISVNNGGSALTLTTSGKGAITFTAAGGGNVLLDNGANGSLNLVATNGAIKVTAGGNVTMSGATTHVGLAISAGGGIDTATGAVLQAGAIQLLAGTGIDTGLSTSKVTSATSTAGDVILTNTTASNALYTTVTAAQGNVSVVQSGGGTLSTGTVLALGDLTLQTIGSGGIQSSGTLTAATVDLTAAGGNIGPLTVNTNALTADATGGSIQINNTSGAGGLTLTAVDHSIGQQVTVTNNTSISVVDVAAPGGTVTLTATSGNLANGGPGVLGTTANLNAPNGNIGSAASPLTTDVTQLKVAAQNIFVANQDPGPLTLSPITSGTVAISNTGDLSFGTMAATGNLTLASGTGNITQQPGTTAQALNLSLAAGGSITQGGGNSLIADQGTLEAGGAIGPLSTTFNSLTVPGAGGITLTNTQALAVNDVVSAGHPISLQTSAGDLSLAGTVTGSTVFLEAPANIVFNNGSISATGKVTLQAGAAIRTLAPAVTDITAPSVTLTAGTGINATLATQDLTATSTSGNIVLSNTGATDLTLETVQTGSGSVDVSQTGGGGLIVGTLVQATSGNVTLQTIGSGNIVVNGHVTDPTAGQTVSLLAANAINGSGPVTGDTINLTAANGSIASTTVTSILNIQATGGSVAVSNTAGAGGLALTATDFTIGQRLSVVNSNTINGGSTVSSVGGTVALTSTGGSIGTAVNAPVVTQGDTVIANAPGGNIFLTNTSGANGVSLTAVAQQVDVTNNNSISLVNVAAPGGTVTITAATGNLTDGGAGTTVVALGATGNLNAPNGSIGLAATPLQTDVSTLNLTLGQNAFIVNQNPGLLTLGAVTGTGALNVSNTGDFQFGSIGMGRDMTLSSVQGSLIQQAGGTVLAGTVASQTGNVLLTAAQSITLGGAVTSASGAPGQTGTLTLTAQNADLVLQNGSHVLAANGNPVVLTAGRDVSMAGSATVTGTAGSVSITARNGNVTLGQVQDTTAASTLTVNAAGTVSQGPGISLIGTHGILEAGGVMGPLTTTLSTVTAAGQNGTGSTGGLTLTNTQGLLLDNVTASGAVNVSTTAGLLTVTRAQSTAGPLTLTGGNSIQVNGTVQTGGAVTVQATAGDVNLAPAAVVSGAGNAALKAGGGNVTMADGSVLTGANATLAAGGNVLVSKVTAPGTITVTGGGTLTQVNPTESSLNAGQGVLQFTGPITLPLVTLANLSVSSGAVLIKDSENLLLGAVTANGNVDIEAPNSTLTVNGGQTVLSNGGNIVLVGNTGLAVNGSVQTNSAGDISLSSTGGNISLGPASTLNAAGSFALKANSGVNLDGTLTAGQDVTVAVTGAAVSSAGSLTARAGNLTISGTTVTLTGTDQAGADAGVTGPNGVAISNVTAGRNLTVSAPQGAVQVVSGQSGGDLNVTAQEIKFESLSAGANASLTATQGSINGSGGGTLTAGGTASLNAEGTAASVIGQLTSPLNVSIGSTLNLVVAGQISAVSADLQGTVDQNTNGVGLTFQAPGLVFFNNHILNPGGFVGEIQFASDFPGFFTELLITASNEKTVSPGLIDLVEDEDNIMDDEMRKLLKKKKPLPTHP